MRNSPFLWSADLVVFSFRRRLLRAARFIFFATTIPFAGVKELDKLIEQHSEWKLERIPAIDRAILRLAIYELRANTAQRRMVFNEAIELAKKYSGDDSTRYLNGILHAVGKTVKKS